MDTPYSKKGRVNRLRLADDQKTSDRRLEQHIMRATVTHRQLTASRVRMHEKLRTTEFIFGSTLPVAEGPCELSVVSRVHRGKTAPIVFPFPGDRLLTEDGTMRIDILSVVCLTPGYRSALVTCHLRRA